MIQLPGLTDEDFARLPTQERHDIVDQLLTEAETARLILTEILSLLDKLRATDLNEDESKRADEAEAHACTALDKVQAAFIAACLLI